MYDLTSVQHDEDDVLIMASDGLWERLSNEKVLICVQVLWNATL